MEVYKVFALRKDGKLESCIKYQFASSDGLSKELSKELTKYVKQYTPGVTKRYRYPRYVYLDLDDARAFIDDSSPDLLSQLGHIKLSIWSCAAPTVYEVPFLSLGLPDKRESVGTGKPLKWHLEQESGAWYSYRWVATELTLLEEVL